VGVRGARNRNASPTRPTRTEIVRWDAVMNYRTDNEAPEVEQDLKELGELP
jgi:hypothetical protein